MDHQMVPMGHHTHHHHPEGNGDRGHDGINPNNVWFPDDFSVAPPVPPNSNAPFQQNNVNGAPPSNDGAPERSNTELVLPQALEDVLALKDRREMQMGDDEVSSDPQIREPLWERDENATETTEVDDIIKNNKSTNVPKSKKKKKKRKNRSQKMTSTSEDATSTATQANATDDDNDKLDNIEIEYVQESINLHELAPQYRQFYSILESFKIEQNEAIPPPVLALPVALSTKTTATTPADDQFQEALEEADDKKPTDKTKLSKRKLKKLTRLSVAELKQLVHRPDVVEMHDVTARDPRLLVQLKAHRNTVQVPRHWCFKRKYLQGKRGIEKPPFNLPDFIRRTGIMEMRASLQDKDESKTLKAKQRDKIRPKLGKIDIDYQKLHDAFFKWQTKPKMTIHGDLYYEGKEFETRLREKKPGDLSEELRTALGMPIGMNANKVPPPWLIAMQRYGPPPNYPNLKIPGLNAPIPDACAFGYHAGGWGKPPVDEHGKPLYGDVFGTNAINMDDVGDDATLDRTLWGELESESEEESEEEEEEGDEEEPPLPDETGLITPTEGLVTPSGLTSIPTGMETPEAIELRKKKIESEMEQTEVPNLYQVLPERRNERIGGAMMASTHVYDVSGVATGQTMPTIAPPPPPPPLPPPPPPMVAGVGANVPPARKPGEREGTVELALDPSELDMDSDAMAMRYEQQIRESQSQLQKEDLSDMLAEHVAKQKSKRKRAQQQDTKQAKKYKEFKF